MKKYLFILAVFSLLVITACSQSTPETTVTDTSIETTDTVKTLEEIDTAEIDDLEKDLQAIDEVL